MDVAMDVVAGGNLGLKAEVGAGGGTESNV